MSGVGQYMTILAELNPLEPITSVPLLKFHVGPWEVIFSNHGFMVIVSAVLLMIVVSLAARSPKLVPRGLQNLIESICVFIREELARPILDHNTDTYVGFLWTTFFFILTLNLVAMVPTEKIFGLMTQRVNRFGIGDKRNLDLLDKRKFIFKELLHHLADLPE